MLMGATAFSNNDKKKIALGKKNDFEAIFRIILSNFGYSWSCEKNN